jgi:uncharacterized membrane protein
MDDIIALLKTKSTWSAIVGAAILTLWLTGFIDDPIAKGLLGADVFALIVSLRHALLKLER